MTWPFTNFLCNFVLSIDQGLFLFYIFPPHFVNNIQKGMYVWLCLSEQLTYLGQNLVRIFRKFSQILVRILPIFPSFFYGHNSNNFVWQHWIFTVCCVGVPRAVCNWYVTRLSKQSRSCFLSGVWSIKCYGLWRHMIVLYDYDCMTVRL